MGEALKQMADVKYAFEDNVKQNFLEPLTQLQNKDVRDVQVCLGPWVTRSTWVKWTRC